MNCLRGVCGQARSHPFVKNEYFMKEACEPDIVVHVEFEQIKIGLG